MKYKDLGTKISILITNNPKTLFFVTLSTACFILSIVFAFRDNAFAYYGYIFFSLAALVFGIPSTVEYFKLPGVEMRMQVREVKEAAAEIRMIAKHLAEITILMAHKSTGWAEGIPATVRPKDTMLEKAFELIKMSQIESDDLKFTMEYHHAKTCTDHIYFIYTSLDDQQKKKQFQNKIKYL